MVDDPDVKTGERGAEGKDENVVNDVDPDTGETTRRDTSDARDGLARPRLRVTRNFTVVRLPNELAEMDERRFQVLRRAG